MCWTSIALGPHDDVPKHNHGTATTSPLVAQATARESLAKGLQQMCEMNLRQVDAAEKDPKKKMIVAPAKAAPWRQVSDFAVNEDDTQELHNRLFTSLFLVEGRDPPASNWDLVGLFMLAVLQLAGGIALAATGYGGAFSFWLIGEGLNDLWRVFSEVVLTNDEDRGAIDWGKYCRDKAISLAICAVCCLAWSVCSAWTIAQEPQRP